MADRVHLVPTVKVASAEEVDAADRKVDRTDAPHAIQMATALLGHAVHLTSKIIMSAFSAVRSRARHAAFLTVRLMRSVIQTESTNVVTRYVMLAILATKVTLAVAAFVAGVNAVAARANPQDRFGGVKAKAVDAALPSAT